MIAFIKGNIVSVTSESAVVEINGIGYRIFLPTTATQNIHIGETKEFHTYMHVREDAILLYGFVMEKQKEIFTKLLSISGLGPKTALAVVSNLTVEAFLEAVEKGDTNVFAKVPGIGKKTAQRIILELKGKISFDEAEAVEAGDETAYSIAVEALIGLGYNKADIKKVLNKLEGNASPEETIKQALKYLAKV